MSLSHFAGPMLSMGMAVLAVGAVWGQNYPNKTIRIVTSNAGGGGDFASRVIAQALSGNLGQSVVVENRPSGIIPGEIVSKASPDGYTLLINGVSHWLLPFFQSDLSWDPVKDFLPISMVATSPLVLVVPLIKARRLKPLAVTSAKPSALFPELPTVAATLPGYESASSNGIFAPAKTPRASSIA